MNTILLQPTDVLFFRDGRPMSGSLAGHGAAWPLPNVTDAAFHAALHRSGLNGHKHDQMRHGTRTTAETRQYGSLVTAGPFPVHVTNGQATWYLPRPLDLLDATLTPALLPVDGDWLQTGSLPKPLKLAVANRLPPNKDANASAWLSAAAFQRYVDGGNAKLDAAEACDDSMFSDAEATIGIAIVAATGTTGQGEASGKIYSARYLRLRDAWRLGVFARTDEKNGGASRKDLIAQLINEHHQLLVGGQQRLCTATIQSGAALPLPLGKRDGFRREKSGRSLVKWVLLSPAIWPEIPAQSKDGRPMMPHDGGWLPNWVRQEDGRVMLRSGERQRRTYVGKHTRGFGNDSSAIAATLAAAIVPKPIVVTGWALPNEADPERGADGGAKSTHLAVPAGAVYYFEADSPEAAMALANALNWHGASGRTEIKNRRSTLMGEKGFGLGVCGTWRPFGDVP
jgi:hypothetical protein